MLKDSKFEDIVCGHAIAKGLGIKIHVYLYIIEGLLIDTGPASLSKEICPFLESHKVKQTALTHIHEDHCGNAPWIIDNLKIPVYLHEESLGEALVKTKLPFYRKIVWGNRKEFKAASIPTILETESHRFEVISTPGQHPHHLSFHEKNKGWIFTGDLYVSSKQYVAFEDENISDAIASMKKILKFDFDTLFCSHGGPLKDGRKKLQEKLDFFESLRAKVLDLEKQGLSRKEIDKKLFPKKGLWERFSLNQWSSFNIINTI